MRISRVFWVILTKPATFWFLKSHQNLIIPQKFGNQRYRRFCKEEHLYNFFLCLKDKDSTELLKRTAVKPRCCKNVEKDSDSFTGVPIANQLNKRVKKFLKKSNSKTINFVSVSKTRPLSFTYGFFFLIFDWFIHRGFFLVSV